MKKRIMIVFMAAVLSASLVGCGEDVEAGTTPSGASQVSSSAGSAASSSESKNSAQIRQSAAVDFGQEYKPDIKGVNYKINLLLGTKGKKMWGGLYVNAIEYNRNVSYGVGQYYHVHTFKKEDVKTPEDIFPKFKKEFINMCSQQESAQSLVKNPKIKVNSTERVKINEYEMCITRGVYTFDFIDENNPYSGKYPFTYYGAFLADGTPVYWFTTDVSIGSIANTEQEELALNMAKTLRE